MVSRSFYNAIWAKRNALGDLLGYPREVQKNISLFLDKVLADAEDIERWEGMPPEVKQFFQPQLEEKESGLQWLEDSLRQQEEDNGITGDIKSEPGSFTQGEQEEALEALAKQYGVKYTDTERYELLRRYHKSVTQGWLSPLVDFTLYEDYYQEIQDRVVGQVVGDVEIKGQSQHFLERVFGCMQDPKTGRARNGVALEDVFDCIENPVRIEPIKVDEKGRPSFAIEGRHVRITVNPDTGTLIQANLWG